MKYTRLNPKREYVTFSVSFIAEPVTVPALKSLPVDAIVRAHTNSDLSGVLAALDDELEVILTAATLNELEEFMSAWNKASDAAEAEAKSTASRLNWLFGGGR